MLIKKSKIFVRISLNRTIETMDDGNKKYTSPPALGLNIQMNAIAKIGTTQNQIFANFKCPDLLKKYGLIARHAVVLQNISK